MFVLEGSLCGGCVESRFIFKSLIGLLGCLFPIFSHKVVTIGYVIRFQEASGYEADE